MKENSVLKELLIGNILCGIVVQIVCILVAKDFLYHAVGLWCGVGLSCFICVHIKRSIEDELEFATEAAEKHARQMYAVRMIIAFAVMGLVVVLKIGNPLTIILGIFPLKLSVYLKPYMHKLIVWFDGHKMKK